MEPGGRCPQGERWADAGCILKVAPSGVLMRGSKEGRRLAPRFWLEQLERRRSR